MEIWEDLADKRKYFATFTMNEATLRVCEASNVATPLSVERDRRTDTYTVRFDLVELHRYISFLCEHVGFTVGIDGGVTTKDGCYIPSNPKKGTSTK